MSRYNTPSLIYYNKNNYCIAKKNEIRKLLPQPVKDDREAFSAMSLWNSRDHSVEDWCVCAVQRGAGAAVRAINTMLRGKLL